MNITTHKINIIKFPTKDGETDVEALVEMCETAHSDFGEFFDWVRQAPKTVEKYWYNEERGGFYTTDSGEKFFTEEGFSTTDRCDITQTSNDDIEELITKFYRDCGDEEFAKTFPKLKVITSSVETGV